MPTSTKSKRASGFDPEAFLKRHEGQDREREERNRVDTLLREYSVPWNILDNTPPFQGLKLNSCLVRWEPENIDEFIKTHGEEFKRWKASLSVEEPEKAQRNSGKSRSGTTVTGKKPDSVKPTNQSGEQIAEQSKPQSTATAEQEKPDESVHRCSGTTVLPQPEGDTTQDSPSEAMPPANAQEDPAVPDSQDDVRPSEVGLNIGNSAAEPSAELPKKSRVSAKRVASDFDELTRRFLHTASIDEKCPVFLPLDIKTALVTLAQVSGVPKLAPSHIVINILREFFDEHRDLINRKLSGVKLSI